VAIAFDHLHSLHWHLTMDWIIVKSFKEGYIVYKFGELPFSHLGDHDIKRSKIRENVNVTPIKVMQLF